SANNGKHSDRAHYWFGRINAHGDDSRAAAPPPGGRLQPPLRRHHRGAGRRSGCRFGGRANHLAAAPDGKWPSRTSSEPPLTAKSSRAVATSLTTSRGFLRALELVQSYQITQ